MLEFIKSQLLGLVLLAAFVPPLIFCGLGVIAGLSVWFAQRNLKQALIIGAAINMLVAPLIVVADIFVSTGEAGGRGSPIALLIWLGPIAFLSIGGHLAAIVAAVLIKRRRKEQPG